MAERTEPATPRRRHQARRRGQGVGRSNELAMGLTLGVGVLALSNLLPGAAARMVTQMQRTIVELDPHASDGMLLGRVGDVIVETLWLTLPLACLVVVAGTAANLASGGLVIAPKAIGFDLGRMNPIKGMRSLFDKGAATRLGIASAKLAILAFITWTTLWDRIPSILATQGSTVPRIAGIALDAIFQLGLTIVVLLAIVALVDFVVQRRRAAQSIRMTKEEVKEEYREQEGDPHVRGEQRRRQRQFAFARMMSAIPTADVVVTNPTTLAVALKYDSLTMRAPRIVAKGQRLMAERIKEIARKHHVPIVEDKPLARALFTRPLNAEVPAHLYRAVARLLVFVHQSRFGVAPRTGRVRRRLVPAWASAGTPGGTTGRGAGPLEAWWMEAAASVGQPVDPDAVAARYGRVEGEPAQVDGAAPDTGTEDGAAAEDVDLDDLTDAELLELEAGLDAQPDAQPGDHDPDEPHEGDAR